MNKTLNNTTDSRQNGRSNFKLNKCLKKEK